MVQVISDQEFILQWMMQFLIKRADTNNPNNLILQLTLTELVKQVMRELARDEESHCFEGNLLQKAVQITSQKIQERTEPARLQLDLSLYFQRIYRSQRLVAREMTELGFRLQQAWQGEILRPPRVITNALVPFEIAELGLREVPEGLIAYPLTLCQLNMEQVHQDYQVHGMNFPWEVVVNEFVFVVEADGSIITFLEGFPSSFFEQSQAALIHLATALYIPLET